MFKRKLPLLICMMLFMTSCSYKGEVFSDAININYIRNYEHIATSVVGIQFRVTTNFDTIDTLYEFSCDIGVLNTKKDQDPKCIVKKPNEIVEWHQNRTEDIFENFENYNYGFINAYIKEKNKIVGYILFGVGDTLNEGNSFYLFKRIRK